MLDKEISSLFNTYVGILHENVPMGILPYDILSGGDIQLGSCIAIGGAEGAGKSTTFMQMCKSIIESQGRNVVYVDAEKSGAFMKQLNSFDIRKYTQFADDFDPKSTIPKLWWINNINTYNEFQGLCKRLIQLKASGKVNYEYIILDSVSALTQTKMINGNCEDAAVAYDALPISKLIKSVRGILYNAGITLCFVAQASSNIGAGMYDPTWTLKLTRSIRHCCDILYCIEKPDYKSYKIFKEGQSIQGKDNNLEIGYIAKLWTIKNRAVRSQKLTVPIIYGRGVDNIRFLNEILQGPSGAVTSRMNQGVRRYKINLTGRNEDLIVIDGDENYDNWVIQHYDEIVSSMYEKGGLFDLSSKNYMLSAATDDRELTEDEVATLSNLESDEDIQNYANDQGIDTNDIEPEAIEDVMKMSDASESDETVTTQIVEAKETDMSQVQNLESVDAILGSVESV